MTAPEHVTIANNYGLKHSGHDRVSGGQRMRVCDRVSGRTADACVRSCVRRTADACV